LFWQEGFELLRAESPVPADAATGAQFESDFDLLDAAELVKQLPGAQRGALP
jgi:hypothetical protein